MGLAGYREACNIAQERLEAVAVDHSGEPDAFRNDLLNIARTTLSSKILTQVRHLHFVDGCTNCSCVQLLQHCRASIDGAVFNFTWTFVVQSCVILDLCEPSIAGQGSLC